MAAAYAESGVASEVIAFERDMPARYRWADFALCRSGALSVAELALAGLPSLLVPYPYAADDHQRANARALADAGAARVLEARPLASAELVKAIQACFESPDELQAMGARAAGLARPDAAETIVADCVALVGPEWESR